MVSGIDYSSIIETEQPRLYWRILLIAVVALIIAWSLIVALQLAILVPLYVLAFGLLVPVIAAIFWREHGGPSLSLRSDFTIAFGGGAILGLFTGILLLGVFALELQTLLGSGLLSVCEEILKILPILYFARTMRRSEIDMILLGVASALGFCALETASFGYITFQQSNNYMPGISLFRAGISNMDHILAFQLLSQLFGQPIWTAIICAAFWRERRNTLLPLGRGVTLACGIALVLHVIWNYAFVGEWFFIHLDVAYIPVFNLIIAAIGFFILSFFIRESLQQSSDDPQASPPPLDRALVAYVSEFRRKT